MSEITQLNEKAIAVELNKDGKSYMLNKDAMGTWFLGYKTVELLPPGSWSILGRPEEMTREQCEKVMEGYDGSLYTLLTEKNIKPEDSVIILIKNEL